MEDHTQTSLKTQFCEIIHLLSRIKCEIILEILSVYVALGQNIDLGHVKNNLTKL